MAEITFTIKPNPILEALKKQETNYMGEIFLKACRKVDMNKILEEIKLERERQDSIWGGPKHDDKYNLEDWRDFIEEYCNNAVSVSNDWESSRKELIKVAALAVACIESGDRKYNASIK